MTGGHNTSHIHGAESIADAETTGCNENAEMGERGIHCNIRYSQRCCFDSAESSSFLGGCTRLPGGVAGGRVHNGCHEREVRWLWAVQLHWVE